MKEKLEFWLAEIKAINKEKEEYIDDVIETVLPSNDVCKFVLGNEGFKCLLPGNYPPTWREVSGSGVSSSTNADEGYSS